MTMTLEPTRASHHDDAPPASSAPPVSSVPSAGIIDFNAPATAGLVMYECQRVRTDLAVCIEAVRAELIERIEGLRAEMYRLANRQTLQILGIMITLLTAQTALLLALL